MRNEDIDYKVLFQDANDQIKSLTAALEANRESLRDKFAMAALVGMVANPRFNSSSPDELIAHGIFEFADRVLAAREKSKTT